MKNTPSARVATRAHVVHARNETTRRRRLAAIAIGLVAALHSMALHALPPVADAGADRVVSKTLPQGAQLSLDGSGSSDPENDALSYRWYGAFGTQAGVSPSVVVPEGQNVVTLIANDGGADSTPDSAAVSVEACFSVTVVGKRGLVELTWPAQAGAAGYTVYRADESAPGAFASLATVAAGTTVFTDTAVINEVVYLYTVQADTAGGCFSDVVSARPSALRSRTKPNNAPQIYSAPVVGATSGIAYVYDVNASDPDGDALAYALNTAPAGMTIDAADGVIAWTPAAAGNVAVIVEVADGRGGVASQSFALAVDDPVAVDVTVPGVIGLAQGDAEAAVVAAGLTVGVVSTAFSNSAAPGIVIGQNPAGGASAASGSAVDLVVSLGPQTVTVPDMVGLSQAAAEAAVLGANLTVGVVTTANSNTVPVGDVISQNPAAGATAVINSAVDLVVSLGPVTVTVPDVVGLTQAAAEAAILGANLTVGTVTTANSNTVPAGDVISQNPAAGATAVINSAVDLVVSLGPVTVTVPDVVGLSQAAAEAAIVGANLTVGAVTTANSDTVPAGDVISQNPAAGVTAVINSAVDLVVSLGPVTVTVPDVVGLSQAAAEAAIVAANLTVGVVTTANSDTVAAGNVISQNPPGAASVAAGSAVDLVVSLGVAAADFERPVVLLTIDPAVVNAGENVTLTVTASDNVAVVSTQLTIDGAPVALDAGGTAIFTSPVAGVFVAEARALDAAGNQGSSTGELRFQVAGDTTPPTVAITAPADNATLAMPADIVGTAGDDTQLTRYTLEISPAGRNQYTRLAAGTAAVTNGVLGRFDPTVLRNGFYDVRLSAEDAGGNTASIVRTYKAEGEAKVGNFSLTFTDLEIPVSGLPIKITRSYDSRQRANGDFGFGWRLALTNVEVSENGPLGDGWQQTVTGGFFPTYRLSPTRQHRVTVTFPDGGIDEFDMVLNPTSSVLFPFGVLIGTTASFNAAPGTFSTLVSLENNALSVVGPTVGPIQLFDDFIGLGGIYDPDRYRLTGSDGTQLVLNQASGVETITDPNGNTITFGAGGIIHSAGQSVIFTRDGQGRITTITDPAGNTLRYEYDFYGDLVAFTDQEGNVTRFTYNSAHGLLDTIDPRGVQATRNEYDADGRLVASIDAAGNRVEFDHDLAARQEVIRDRNGNVQVFGYDEAGNITSTTDALGNTTSFTYDADGNALTQTDPLGNTVSRTFDAAGNETSETDPLGNTTTRTFNARNKEASVTDANGNVTTNGYDARGNLTQVADPLGFTRDSVYGPQGDVTRYTDEIGNVRAFTYDAFGNRTSEVDALGNTIAWTFDANGNQLTETRSRTTDAGVVTVVTSQAYDSRNRVIAETDGNGDITRIEYNAIGKVAAEIDANGNRTEHEYDSRGNVVRTRFPDGTEETQTYDAQGNKLTTTDRAGRTTTFQYDALNRLVGTTYPDGSAVATLFDAAGRVIGERDENGNLTTLEYDAAGRNTRIVDALGNASTFTYDANGNQLSVTDARGNTTSYEYDALNRETRRVFPDGTSISVVYDGLGRKIAETDQAGSTTLFAYDAQDRPVQVTDALGGVTAYGYDELGNQVSQTDAEGRVTRWTYDNAGNVLSRTLPLGQTETFTYDANGNQLTHTDFNGDTTTFAYDVNDRLVTKTYADGSGVSMTYTPSGKLASVTDARGLTTYAYDLRDRLTQTVNADGSTLGYEYDAVGNRTRLVTPAGASVMTYDAMNRLETVTDIDGGTSVYTYDAVGNRSSVTHANGTAARYTYDGRNRLTRLVNERADGTPISGYTYTLGPVGNRTRLAEDGGRTVDYTYDALFRLLREDVTTVPGVTTVIDYTYDAVGNRLSKSVDGIAANSTYDANDRLLDDGGKTYAYDANGSMIASNDGVAVTDYVYDFERRLVRVVTGTSAIDYTYDAHGNRVGRNVDGVATRFVVDTNTEFAQVLEERDGAGALLVRYTIGDDLLSQTRGALTSYYHADGTGSTRALSDASEAVTDTYTFDAFGILTDSTGSTLNEFLFTGEQYDANIGFYYLRARWLDPETARFLTMDDFAGLMFDPSSLHKYTYARNNPVNMIDPSGRAYALMYVSMARFGLYSLLFLTLYYALIQLVEVMMAFVNLAAIVRWWENAVFMSSGSTQDKINGLLAQAEIHADKIGSSPPEDPNQNHWKKEVKAFLERALRLAKKRLKGKTRDEAIRRIMDLARRAGVTLSG